MLRSQFRLFYIVRMIRYINLKVTAIEGTSLYVLRDFDRMHDGDLARA